MTSKNNFFLLMVAYSCGLIRRG